jgi:hypothetical protein
MRFANHDGRSSKMILSIGALIAYLSSVVELVPCHPAIAWRAGVKASGRCRTPSSARARRSNCGTDM